MKLRLQSQQHRLKIVQLSVPSRFDPDGVIATNVIDDVRALMQQFSCVVCGIDPSGDDGVEFFLIEFATGDPDIENSLRFVAQGGWDLLSYRNKQAIYWRKTK